MLQNHELTQHAQIRMSQRAFRPGDVALLLRVASQVAPDAYLLTAHDVQREVERRKQEIRQLERLRDCKLVVADGAIVTCYRSGRKDQKKTLRRGRDVQ